jgi:hypothetical protein
MAHTTSIDVRAARKMLKLKDIRNLEFEKMSHAMRQCFIPVKAEPLCVIALTTKTDWNRGTSQQVLQELR